MLDVVLYVCVYTCLLVIKLIVFQCDDRVATDGVKCHVETEVIIPLRGLRATVPHTRQAPLLSEIQAS
jgi:hypothetical protein